MPLDSLRRIVIESDTRRGRIFDLVIQVLIVISLIDFTLGNHPWLATGARGSPYSDGVHRGGGLFS